MSVIDFWKIFFGGGRREAPAIAINYLCVISMGIKFSEILHCVYKKKVAFYNVHLSQVEILLFSSVGPVGQIQFWCTSSEKSFYSWEKYGQNYLTLK